MPGTGFPLDTIVVSAPNKGLVRTQWCSDFIEQQTIIPGIAEVARRIICLQDEGIRKALIDLGWTPPPDTNTQEEA